MDKNSKGDDLTVSVQNAQNGRQNDNLNYAKDIIPQISQSQIQFYSNWINYLQHTEDSTPILLTAEEILERIVDTWKYVKSNLHTYRCIQQMSFLDSRAKSLLKYPNILEFNKLNPSLQIANIGCCFGQDDRQLILDGISPQSITSIDIIDGYFEAGKHIFQDSLYPTTSPIHHIHNVWCNMCLPLNYSASFESILGEKHAFDRYDFIILQAVLHCISREQSVHLLTRIYNMLKSSTQSIPSIIESNILMGICVGCKLPEGQDWQLIPDKSAPRFLHSCETLTELLTKIGFREVNVWEGREEDIASNMNAESALENLEFDQKTYLQFYARK